MISDIFREYSSVFPNVSYPLIAQLVERRTVVVKVGRNP